MPVTLAPKNRPVRVVKIAADEKVRKHLIELGINLVLSPIIERIIRLRKKGVV